LHKLAWALLFVLVTPPLSACQDGETIPYCPKNCVCEGPPGRPDTPCSQCNPHGEVFIKFGTNHCTMARATGPGQQCRYNVTSSDPSAATPVPDFFNLPIGTQGTKKIQTFSNGPTGTSTTNVIITATSDNNSPPMLPVLMITEQITVENSCN
jgi:hypothetical protein